MDWRQACDADELPSTFLNDEFKGFFPLSTTFVFLELKSGFLLGLSSISLFLGKIPRNAGLSTLAVFTVLSVLTGFGWTTFDKSNRLLSTITPPLGPGIVNRIADNCFSPLSKSILADVPLADNVILYMPATISGSWEWSTLNRPRRFSLFWKTSETIYNLSKSNSLKENDSENLPLNFQI